MVFCLWTFWANIYTAMSAADNEQVRQLVPAVFLMPFPLYHRPISRLPPSLPYRLRGTGTTGRGSSHSKSMVRIRLPLHRPVTANLDILVLHRRASLHGHRDAPQRVARGIPRRRQRPSLADVPVAQLGRVAHDFHRLAPG